MAKREVCLHNAIKFIESGSVATLITSLNYGVVNNCPTRRVGRPKQSDVETKTFTSQKCVSMVCNKLFYQPDRRAGTPTVWVTCSDSDFIYSRDVF